MRARARPIEAGFLVPVPGEAPELTAGEWLLPA